MSRKLLLPSSCIPRLLCRIWSLRWIMMIKTIGEVPQKLSSVPSHYQVRPGGAMVIAPGCSRFYIHKPSQTNELAGKCTEVPVLNTREIHPRAKGAGLAMYVGFLAHHVVHVFLPNLSNALPTLLPGIQLGILTGSLTLSIKLTFTRLLIS